MKMVRYKQILAAACVFAALGASNVAAAETTLNENDLVIDKTVVTFKNLEVGVYLIYAQDTETYDTVEPSLIAVPTWNDSEGEMQYDVMIAPKHTEKPEKEDNVAPQTSLQENTWKYVTAAGICVCGALLCTILYKRKH